MRLVHIQEFSLNTAVEYESPVQLREARLETIAKALCASSIAPFINPAEISRTQQNDLYAYSLSVPMFGGAAGIAINAQSVTVTFKQGKSDAHLKLMLDLTLDVLRLAKVQDVKRSLASF